MEQDHKQGWQNNLDTQACLQIYSNHQKIPKIAVNYQSRTT